VVGAAARASSSGSTPSALMSPRWMAWMIIGHTAATSGSATVMVVAILSSGREETGRSLDGDGMGTSRRPRRARPGEA
jgi:hypothetical protein